MMADRGRLEWRRALERAAADHKGHPLHLCEVCGAPMVVAGPAGLGCLHDPDHEGQVAAPTQAEAELLARLRRVLREGQPLPDDIPQRMLGRLAYIALRAHGWGDHRHCRLLPLMGLQDLGCLPPPVHLARDSEGTLW